MKPIIFLAFANDKQNTGAGYLRGLTAERNGIRDALKLAERQGLCEVLVEPDASINRIFNVFQENQDRIAIFHYGGHAGSYELLLESAAGTTEVAHSEGLVSFLARQKGLQMVFLNGCSSQKQSLDLIQAGLSAVVGTSEAIEDTVATGLSVRFYKALAAGNAIERAWLESVDQIKTEKGGSSAAPSTGGLFWAEEPPEPGRFPWELHFGEAGPVVKTWSLPEAARQPLFGLELPQAYYRKLPQIPYAGLQSYQREEAAVFFGRG
ncbi:MAG: CHAT domain-containing protein, partial [Bacteroidetes bacterium]